jgi:histidinol-phosphate/aromatic aminotransferase/cobyric acid decarboxylase-like protein/choline kinase
MVTVHSQTLIERMLGQLCRERIRRVIIVVGYRGENVRSLVGDSFRGMPVLYVENTVYDRTNNIYSLFLAREYLMQDDTVLLESDIIFSDGILKELIRDPYPNLAVVAKYRSWMDGTVVTLDEHGNILNFISGKAFCYKEKDRYYKTVNMYKFSAAFSAGKYVPFLEAYCRALGNNEYYEQVLRVISFLDTPSLRAMAVEDEKWYEIDDVQDLHNAEVLFAAREDAPDLYAKRRGGYWRFPLTSDFSNPANPYFPHGTMLEEMESEFRTLLTSPPSEAGLQVRLAARFTGLPSGQVATGQGAAELTDALLRLHDVKTGFVFPAGETCRDALSPSRIRIYRPDSPDFSYTADSLADCFEGESLRQLVLVNPGNPSGQMLPKEEMLRLAAWAKSREIRLIIDESFAGLAGEDRRYTLLDRDFLSENPHVVVVRSISESYGVPGLRLAFLASACTELVKKIKEEVPTGHVNSFAEFFMQIFIKYENVYEQACLRFADERERFYAGLKAVPYLRVIPSCSAYFLCEVTGTFSAQTLCSRLLSGYNMLIKDCTAMMGAGYVRIAIRGEQENGRLIDALWKLGNEPVEMRRDEHLF